jgi:hypothetical protein
MQFLITEIVGVYLLVGVVSSCPSVCNCYNDTERFIVSCISKDLDSIPTDIPKNTYKLQVYDYKNTMLSLFYLLF